MTATFSPRAVRSVHPHACGDDGTLGSMDVGEAVHPHACGDDAALLTASTPLAGPSPRLWGRCTRPAPSPCASPVHPHACGDDEGLGAVAQALPRSIPTPVGTIGRRASLPSLRAVHPHACGDDCAKTRRPERDSGPSPRLWGRCVNSGFRLSHRSTAVHPHACGDDGRAVLPVRHDRRSIPTPVGTMGTVSSTTTQNIGPSPRLWGRYRGLHEQLPRLRSIPTPVGTIQRRDRLLGVLRGPSPRLWGR